MSFPTFNPDPSGEVIRLPDDTGTGGTGPTGPAGANGTNGLNADMTRDSTTSLAIGTGSKAFTFTTASSNLGWLVGTRLRAASASGTTNFMEGVATAVSSTGVTINVDNTGGSGTKTDWNITVVGAKGDTGATGAAGPAGDLGGQTIYDFLGVINLQTGTTYTMQSSDTGKIVECNNGSAITVTLPNSLVVGWNVLVTQMGAGQVSFSAAAGATLRNRSTQTKIAGQYGCVSLYVRANSGGSSAEYVLAGDTGT